MGRIDDMEFPDAGMSPEADSALMEGEYIPIGVRMIADAFAAAPPPSDARIISVRSASDAWTADLAARADNRFFTVLSRPIAGGKSGWVGSVDSRDQDKVLDALERGRRVLLIAADESAWPPLLQRAIEHRIDASDLARYLPGVPAALLAGATPLVCDIARRDGQSPDDFAEAVCRLVEPTKAKARAPWSLDNLHGMDAAVSWGRDLCRDLADYRAGRLAWADVDRGALLVGPPGCGKTTFAAALSASAGVPLIAASFSKWDSVGKNGYLSDLQKAMRQDFDDAKKSSPCILFIDELDSIPSRGAGSNHDDYWTAVVNCLLECLDGVSGRDGVIVVGATNRDSGIDPAILRSGRLDRRIALGLPDAAALASILAVHLGSADGVDLAAAAKAAVGGSGADCERWVRGARRIARTSGRALRTADLLSEIRGPADTRTDAQRWRIAVHEAGHAVSMMSHGRTLTAVSIRAGADHWGYASAEAASLEGTAEDVHALIVDRLAGRAAEEIVLGSVSVGAIGDLQSATAMSASAAAAWGLGGSLVYRGDPSGSDVGQFLALNRDLIPFVGDLLESAYADALDGVRASRAAIERVARALLQCESLDGVEVLAAVQGGCSETEKPPGVCRAA